MMKSYRDIFCPGNYILVFNRDRTDPMDRQSLFTITEYTSDSAEKTITVYGEDAGLELVNETLPSLSTTGVHPISWFVANTIMGTGFTIGINEFSDTKPKKRLSFEAEQTVKERLDEIADYFNAEIAFSFSISGMRVGAFFVDIYKRVGTDTEKRLKVGREISTVRETVNFADLATGFIVVGGTGTGSIPINLEGYAYDDGDCFVSGRYLYSREGLKRWARYDPSTGQQVVDQSGYIVKKFQFDTVSQERLCKEAVKELKKVSKLQHEYETEFFHVPEDVHIGDSVIIDDDEEGLHLKARIVSMETSDYTGDITVGLVDYTEVSAEEYE